MGDGMIHIKAKRREYTATSTAVKLRPDAYNTLVDICNESSMSLSETASEIILQSADRIVYDREEP
ncbi:MAG: hypothetical protein KH828_07710 [Clostridiales bacterium]|nr:hypothetical protein [Clostridiales bacterium]